MVDTGPPINDEYCSNQACTFMFDEMKARIASDLRAKAVADRVRDAAPELLAALEAICAEADRMAMTMRRRAIFDAGRAAIAKARGEVA